MYSRLLAVFICVAAVAPSVQAQTREHTIEISSQGFSTTSLEINVGDAVVWKNTDTDPHWPASNLHPSHALYAEFDPLQPIAPGSEWQFVFERGGEWRFHDHLYPARGGVIVVHGSSTQVAAPSRSPSSVSIILARIHRFLPGWVLNMLSFETITAIVTDITVNASPEAALEFIHNRLDGVSDTTGAAVHGLKHIVGQALYERDGIEGLVVCALNPDSAVDGACYHGVMEAYFVEQSMQGPLDSVEFERLCTPWVSRNDCLNIFHGLGHGYASFVGLDLEKALELCAYLPTAERIGACMTGVNMEWSESIPYGQLEMLRNDPWKLCRGMRSVQFQASCAFEMARVFSFLNEGRQNIDFDMHDNGDAIGKGCAGAPTDTFRKLCFQGSGFMASIRSTPAHSVAEICEHLGKEQDAIRLCLIAAAQRLALMNQSEFIDEQKEVCRLLHEKYEWPTCYRMPSDAPSRELLGSRPQ